MKRKLEKPEVKIVKLHAMDVIATSGDTPVKAKKVGLQSLTNYGTAWMKNPPTLQ